jgi:hypothetical protein
MTNVHRLTLYLALGLAAAALVYNAVSVLNGDPGLLGLTPDGIDHHVLASIDTEAPVEAAAASR